MTAKIMDGKKIAEEVKANIKREVDSLRSRGVSPCLATILICLLYTSDAADE